MFTAICVPALIDPTDFNLSDPKENARLLKDLLKKKKRVLDQVTLGLGEDYTPSYTLYETGSTPNVNTGYIFLHNTTLNRLDYVVNFTRNFSGGVKGLTGLNTMTQIAVWRKPGVSLAQELTNKVFFTHLLPKTKSLCTDGQQTPNGQNFWFHRIKEAWKLELKVYFVAVDKGIVFKLNGLNLDKLENCIWGVGPRYKNRFVVISTENIPNKGELPEGSNW